MAPPVSCLKSSTCQRTCVLLSFSSASLPSYSPSPPYIFAPLCKAPRFQAAAPLRPPICSFLRDPYSVFHLKRMAILICEAICPLILFSPDPLQISRGPQAPQRPTDFDDQQRSWELRRYPLLQDELVPLVVSEGLSVDTQLLCAIFQPEARV